ncbi:MAG: hypothetical protein ACLFVJ_07885 [Persicimonas sp.]
MDLSSRFFKLTAGRARLLAASMALFVFAAFGCDGGCGCNAPGGMPGTADGRSQEMASHLPGDTEVAFVVGDLAKMRDSLATTRDTFGDTLPMADLVEEQAKDELGIDLFDAQSFKDTGIVADGAMTITVAGKYPVLLTYVDDQQKFEKAFSDQFKKSFGTEGMPKGESVGDQQLKVLGDEPAQSAAWAYDGKLAIIGFPPSDEIETDTDDDRDVKQVIADLAGQQEEGSLASVAGYKKFNDALATDQSMALFINTEAAMTEERMTQLEGQANPMAGATAKWIEHNVDAMGFGLHAEKNTIKLRTWASLPDDVAKRAQKIMTPAKDAPMGNFSTENTMMALRMSVDMPELWKFYKETAPPAQRDQIVNQLEQGTQTAKLDLEEDIINGLSGNLAIYFYGVDKQMVEAAGGQLMAVFQNPVQALALMIPLQFKTPEAREKVSSALAPMGFSKNPVKDDVEVLEMNVERPVGSFYLKGDLFVWASEVFSDDSVADYINGKRDEKKLSDIEDLNLGAELADDKKYNGLYLNFMRAKDHLGELLTQSMPQQATSFIDKLEEAALTTEVNESGAFLDLSIDLTPQAAANSAGDESDGDKE